MAASFLQRKKKGILAQQLRAWRFYGIPWPERSTKKKVVDEPIGEIRYVVGWMADQMSRMDWTITVNGEEKWSLKLPDGETVRVQEDKDGSSLRESSQKILDLIGWNPNVVRQITTNLFVAGEFDYIADEPKDDDGKPVKKAKPDDPEPDLEWRVISVVHPDRDEILDEAKHKIHGLWEHPADTSLPDAPLFGVIPVLEDIAWLSRLSRSQSASRISLRGILAIADGFSFANGGDFWQELLKLVRAKMDDPTNVDPIVARGAKDLVAAAAGGGMGGMSWLVPKFPYDDQIDHKIERAIHRLAFGLPIPPEILLGLSDQSMATAFQVEDNSYKAHIEPPAEIVAAIATEAAKILFPNDKIKVNPDPTELLARRHSVQDAKEALMVCAIGFAYYRDVLGIPEDAAPTAEDLALLLTLFGKGEPAVTQDPANQADQDPNAVSAAAVGGPDDDPLSDTELTKLSRMLADIDATLLMELGGATQQATVHAREKVGARTRTFAGLRDAVPKEIPNERVAAHLGMQVLNDTGVPVGDIVAEAISPLLSWWEDRIRTAREDLYEILGDEARDSLDDSFLTGSTDLLADLLASHVIDTLESEVAQPLDALGRRTVMAVAGGAAR